MKILFIFIYRIYIYLEIDIKTMEKGLYDKID